MPIAGARYLALCAASAAADAQRRFAADNAAIADRLDGAEHGDLAAVYRDTARRHEEDAERIEASEYAAAVPGDPES